MVDAFFFAEDIDERYRQFRCFFFFVSAAGQFGGRGWGSCLRFAETWARLAERHCVALRRPGHVVGAVVPPP